MCDMRATSVSKKKNTDDVNRCCDGKEKWRRPQNTYTHAQLMETVVDFTKKAEKQYSAEIHRDKWRRQREHDGSMESRRHRRLFGENEAASQLAELVAVAKHTGSEAATKSEYF